MQATIPATDAASAPFISNFRPLFSPRFISQNDAAMYVHALMAVYDPEQVEQGGFIFKLADQHYVATLPIKGKKFSFELSSIFPPHPSGHVTVPEGVEICAAYHSHVDVAFSVMWSSFFSLPDLSNAIRYRALIPSFLVSHPKSGSLLKYSAHDLPATQVLLERLHPQDELTIALEKEMRKGRLDMTDLVRLVATTGKLEVLAPGQIWGSVGTLSPQWKMPSSTSELVAAPYLGPVFNSQLAAFLDLETLVLDTSQQCAGLILKHVQQEKYLYTRPVTVRDSGFSLASFLPQSESGELALPAHYEIDALYHTVSGLPADMEWPALELEQNFFSPADMFHCLSRAAVYPGLPTYLLTPSNASLKYTPAPGPLQDQLFALLNPFGGPRTRLQLALNNGTSTHLDYVHQVIAAGTLQVVTTSPLWRNRGPVAGDWLPLQADAEPDPPQDYYQGEQLVFGPMFDHSDDAVEFQAAKFVSFSRFTGITLKHPQKKTVLAATVFAEQTLTYPRQRIFSPVAQERPAEVEGFEPDGIYFTSGVAFPIDPASAELLPANFFEPQALAFFFDVRRDSFNATAAYWAGRDGALLRYRASNSAAEQALIQRLQPDTQTGISPLEAELAAQQLDTLGFARLVAAAGELRVLKTSSQWKERGPVQFD